MTVSMMSSRICFKVTSGLCWAETTTVSTRVGLPSVYSTVTCDFPSGRRYSRISLRRTSVRRMTSL